MVQTAPERLEARTIPLPQLSADDGLLKVERCGLCGSDVEQLSGDLPLPYPAIPGHEPIGIVAQLGEVAAKRWGIQPGDRVIVEAPVPCRRCEYCSSGSFNLCPEHLSIGGTSIDVAPSLYGGYAEYLYLHPNSTLHRIAPSVPLDIATFYNALACGVSWASLEGGAKLGDLVLVLGAGQRGIACGLVAKAVGAEKVVITGLSIDEHKLAIARRLGADATIDVERENLHDRFLEITDGRRPDLVIDVVPRQASTLIDALELVKSNGTVVLAGTKGNVELRGLFPDTIPLRSITIKGVRGKTSRAYQLAISIIESGRFPLEELASVAYPLEKAVEAIRALGGAAGERAPVCVSLAPGL
jgi:threonine dehydrogenase-like Zn-dependent dehydrogenase